MKVSAVPAVTARGDAGDAQQVGRAGGGLPDRLDEGVGRLAIDAVAVLVHLIAVPVLDVGADLQAVGTGGASGVGNEMVNSWSFEPATAVTVTPLIGAIGPGEGDLRRGESRGVDLLVEGQLAPS